MQYNWLDLIFLFGIVSLVELQVTNLVTTVYLHRYLTHNAFRDINPVVEWFMKTELWVTTGIRKSIWVIVHRKHHSDPDGPDDPHSPYNEGVYAINFHNLRYYRRAEKNPEVQASFRRWKEDWFDRHARLGIYVGIPLHAFGFGLLLPTNFLIGMAFGVLVYLLHAGAYILLNGFVNGQAHWYPDGRPAKPGRNLWWLALLTMWEGLHRNHHDRPSSPRFGPADPGYFTIRILSLLRLARLKDAH